MKYLTAAILALLITGCSGVDVAKYAENSPEFDLFSYFLGETKGWGIVQDRKGRLTRQFVVSIDGQIDDSGRLVLLEHFDWSDGEKSTRTWTISKESNNSYQGEAEDVAGIAKGVAYGNVLNWQYHLNLKIESSEWKIHFDDWMFLQSNGVLLNRASMSKFGIHVGDVTIAFSKNI